jgi:hypothetical protein
MTLVRKHLAEDEAFLRSIIFPEEDRYRYCSRPYGGGYRWFRDPNVIPIEHWHRPCRLNVDLTDDVTQ